MVRAALVIAGRILRQRIRDRSAIIFAVLTPLGLAIAFSMLVNDFTGTYHGTVAIVDNDHGELAAGLRSAFDQLAGQKLIDIKEIADIEAARTAVNDGDADVAVVIPVGFSPAIQTGGDTAVRIISGEAAMSREVARAVVTSFANDVGAVQLTIATVAATGGTVNADVLTRAQTALRAASPISFAGTGTAERVQADIKTFYGAAMAIMFVFFATSYGALALLGERQAGTLSRLLAAPIPQAAILLGGALASMALGLVTMVVLVAATTLIVHASWGPLLPLALLMVAAVIAATGISTLLAGVARTQEQAGGLNAIVAISLAAIGGVFIPLSQAPELLARVSLITPHAWFLRAIDTLSVAGAGVMEVLPSIGVMTAMGLVTGAIGLARARRALVPA